MFCAVALLVTALTPSCDVVRDYGAAGDNRTEDTAAVTAALAACSLVRLPPKHVFLLRPIEIPSHRTLVVDGHIAAWRDIRTWPNSTHKVCATTPYGQPANATKTAAQLESLLWSGGASRAVNVTLTGGGTIDGQGWRWWPLRNDTTHGDYWHDCRPKLVEFGAPETDWTIGGGVADLVMAGVTVKDSPFWSITGRWLKNARFSGVRVTTTGCGYAEAPNTDGFNLQGEDILVEDCAVRNGDDCVPIFPPTRNITVTNLTCECGNGPATCIWPPLSIEGRGGEISDVLFDGVTLNRTQNAVSIKSLPPFVGRLSNATFANFKLHEVSSGTCSQRKPPCGAIAINFLGQGDTVGGASAHDVRIENVSGTAAHPGHVICTEEHPCTGIQMANVDLKTAAGAQYSCAYASGAAEGCRPEPCGWGARAET